MGVLGVLRGVGGDDLEVLGITCLEYAKTTHCDGDSGVLVVEKVMAMAMAHLPYLSTLGVLSITNASQFVK